MLKIFIMMLTGINITCANAQQASISSKNGLPAAVGAGKDQIGQKKIDTLPVLPPARMIWTDRYSVQAKAIPADWATRNWGFFCRQEWKFEKRTGIPFRFRVGAGEDYKK